MHLHSKQPITLIQGNNSTRGGAITLLILAVAAATEHENYRENYYPGAVIVKKMAEAVVIHICSSVMSVAELLCPSLISILCHERILATVR